MKTLATSLLIFAGLFATEAQAFTLTYFPATDTRATGWDGKTLSFDVNYADCPSREIINDAVDAAMDLWNGVPSSRLKLERGEEISTTVAQAISHEHPAGNPVIVCDPNFGATLGVSNDSIPGAATNIQGTTSGRLVFGTLILNTSPNGKANVQTFEVSFLSVILAHEIGHILGLGHSADPKALMYYDASNRVNLALSPDDIDGMTYLYPRKEPLSNLPLGCATITLSDDRGNPRPPGPGALEFGTLLTFCALMTQAFKGQRRRTITLSLR